MDRLFYNMTSLIELPQNCKLPNTLLDATEAFSNLNAHGNMYHIFEKIDLSGGFLNSDFNVSLYKTFKNSENLIINSDFVDLG